MYVAIDANIIIRDIWCRSSHLRVFFDYLHRSPTTNLIFIEPVLVEIEEHFRRELKKKLEGFQAAHKKIKDDLSGVTPPNWQSVMDASLFKWLWVTDAMFVPKNSPLRGIFESHTVGDFMDMGSAKWERCRPLWDLANDDADEPFVRIPLEPSVTEEAFRRAAARDAPAFDGKMRDAAIWLTLLEWLKTDGQQDQPTVFISNDLKAFSDESGNLDEALAREAQQVNSGISYYATVDDFNDKYATPLQHITESWIYERISNEQVQRKLQDHLGELVPVFEGKSDRETGTHMSVREMLAINVTEVEGVKAWEVEGEVIPVSFICVLKDVRALVELQDLSGDQRVEVRSEAENIFVRFDAQIVSSDVILASVIEIMC
jgi:hypothetical protein